MAKILYASDIGSLMYTLIYTRLDLDHVVEVVNRFKLNSDKNSFENNKVNFEVSMRHH